jgi:hypothetical protein
MSTEDKLYVVVMNSLNDYNDYNVLDCFEIFKDLELAKEMLKNIYRTTVDFKYYNYEIKVYKFNNIKYELINESYTYNLDKFIKH